MPKVRIKKLSPKKTKLRLRPVALAVAVALASPFIMSQASAACSTIVNTITDPIPLPSDASPLVSLRKAVKCANSDPTQNIVTFNLPANSTITLKEQSLLNGGPISSFIQIKKDLTIKGPAGSPSSITVQGNGHRIFRSNASLTLENMTLTGGQPPSTEGGGAVYIYSDTFPATILTLNVKNTLITNSHTKAGSGGAILASNTHIFLEKSIISNNSSDGGSTAGTGGGIHSNYPVTLTDSTITNNSTTGEFSSGGGIFTFAKVTLINSEVSKNSTVGPDSHGGGIWTDEGITLEGSTISGNNTKGLRSLGGGLNSRKEIILTNSEVINNYTIGDDSSGGGIRTNTLIKINQSKISGNSTAGSKSQGGGVYIQYDKGKSIIKQSTIANNSTGGDSSPGGGLKALWGHFDIYNSTISNNSTISASSNGGGISAASVKLVQSTVSNNSVAGDASSGGGIHVRGVIDPFDPSSTPDVFEFPTEIIQSTITQNNSKLDKAGGLHIVALRNDAKIVNSIISGNTALGTPDDVLHTAAHNTINVSFSFIKEIQSNIVNNFANNNNIIGIQADLLPLTNNGGPTLTHLPNTVVTNPIVDAGSNAAMPFPQDQRGATRIDNTTVDIGAVETNTAPVPIPAVCVPQ